MRKKGMLLLAAFALMAPFAGRAAASDGGKCDGRYSYLVPDACTYCNPGGTCNTCKIKGCSETALDVPAGG